MGLSIVAEAEGQPMSKAEARELLAEKAWP